MRILVNFPLGASLEGLLVADNIIYPNQKRQRLLAYEGL